MSTERTPVGVALGLFIFCAGLGLFFVIDGSNVLKNINARDHMITTNCSVSSCDQIGKGCYEPCSPRPCTPIAKNCTTYDLTYSLSWNGQTYTQKSQADIGCPLQVTCYFYIKDIDTTLGLAVPDLGLDRVPYVFEIVMGVFCLLLAICTFIVLVGAVEETICRPPNTSNPHVQMP